MKRTLAIPSAVLLLGILVDQVTKSLVVSLMAENTRQPLLGPLDIVHIRNEGAAFGLFQGSNLLLAVAGLLFVVIVTLFRNQLSFLSSSGRIGLAMVLSGSIGNGVDRIFRGGVVDFIYTPFWPTFNVADSLIVIGSAVVLLSVARRDLAGFFRGRAD